MFCTFIGGCGDFVVDYPTGKLHQKIKVKNFQIAIVSADNKNYLFLYDNKVNEIHLYINVLQFGMGDMIYLISITS